MKTIAIEDVRRALTERGCTGLYYPGECGCKLDDLMPCGIAEAQDEGDVLPNGCEAGHVHTDPRPGRGADWMVTGRAEPPTMAQWESSDALF